MEGRARESELRPLKEFPRTDPALFPPACRILVVKKTPMNEREQMVETQLRARGVTNPTVLAAMACVPREDYVRECDRASAYADGPLAIDCHQTISQPYIVAYMTELLAVEPEHKILEIGTGSGYQTAVLLELTNRLFTVETIPQLHESVRKKLASSRLSENRFLPSS